MHAVVFATLGATEQLQIGKTDEYFFSLPQYIFTIRKPA
jgi:hypothetical protein